jgi:hypothetical protein
MIKKLRNQPSAPKLKQEEEKKYQIHREESLTNLTAFSLSWNAKFYCCVHGTSEWSLSQARRIHYTSTPTSFRSIIILSPIYIEIFHDVMLL